METLKNAAKKAYGLVDRAELEAVQSKLDALQAPPTNQVFAVVADADGNSYNTEGEMVTVGQEFKTGDVEGEGDLVVDASTELEDGSVIVTDAEGVISEIQMAGAATDDEADDTSEGDDADEQSNDNLSAAKVEEMMDKKIVKFSEDFFKQFGGVIDEMKKASKEAGDFATHINNAPAATHQSAKRRNEQMKSNTLAERLKNSKNE